MSMFGHPSTKSLPTTAPRQGWFQKRVENYLLSNMTTIEESHTMAIDLLKWEQANAIRYKELENLRYTALAHSNQYHIIEGPTHQDYLESQGWHLNEWDKVLYRKNGKARPTSAWQMVSNDEVVPTTWTRQQANGL